jgi:hypothetical protein
MLRGNRSDDEYEKVVEGRRNASSLGITGTPEARVEIHYRKNPPS